MAMGNIMITKNEIKAEFSFSLFDTDGSKTIDKQELLLILQSTHMAKEEQVESKAKTIFRQVDRDGDGELDIDEFRELIDKFPNMIFPNVD